MAGLTAFALPVRAQEQAAPAKEGTAMLDQIRDQAAATILDIGVIREEDGTHIGWPAIARTREGELIAVYDEVTAEGKKPGLKYTHWRRKD